MFKNIWYFLTFKVYENNLLTSGSSNYLNVIAVIVSLAALSEAFAWGHFGSTFTPENPNLGGFALGIFIFLLFWFFDRTMVTQDMLTEEHALTLEGESYQPNFFEKYKPWIIFVIRLGIVIGSLYITAPFLTQLVFKADIENEMQLQYQSNIENAKNSVLGNIENKIQRQEDYVKELNDRLQQEIGGKRGTGYGKGPVAQSIEEELNIAIDGLEALKLNLEKTQLQLDAAIIKEDIKALESFGIFTVKNSPIFRENSIQKLREQPAFKNTQYAVDGFLILVGLILILAKILQPKSLKLYYSSRLQEAWSSYKQGNYDDYLFDGHKSINMPNVAIPQTFEGIAIEYANTKHQRKADALNHHKNKEKIELDKRQRQEALQNSEQRYNISRAKEAQSHSYQQKVIKEKRQKIQQALDKARSRRQSFLQENAHKKESLITDREEAEQELFECARIYQSKKEDADARQKRIANAENKLLELQELANQLESTDGSVESVKSYKKAQEAVKQQKDSIKNMQDNYLTFERDMNIHEEKLKKVRNHIHHISQSIDMINQQEQELDKIILELELEELRFLGNLATANTTVYQRGDESELPFIAEQQKVDGTYRYTYYESGKQDDDVSKL